MAVHTDVRFSLVLPAEVYDQYSSEEEMVKRLTTCAKYTSQNPLYISDEDKNTLSQIIGRMIRTPGELLSIMRQKHEIKVGSVKVPLDDALITRLETRRFGLTLEELIRRETIESLERFVGLR